MQKFWTVHSAEGSVKEMMLDENAEELGMEEIPEVLSLLPDLAGTDVIELGAGIGRFTGAVARQAKSVLAVDFMEKFLTENKERNKNYNNIEYLPADVTKLDRPTESADVVFSNWLFMYMDDEELSKVVKKMLSWLREGGHLFFRESCFHQSGNIKRTDTNPSYYRRPGYYCSLLRSVSTTAGGLDFGFDLIFSKSVQTYAERKNNSNQICWLVHKVLREKKETIDNNFTTFQEFLDSQQYSHNSILRYERIFGQNYVSTGGKETTEELVKLLNLKEREKVLDIGCGIGGSAFYMAKTYNVSVYGLDLSCNMIEIALERHRGIGDKRVQFEVSDATKRELPAASYDVVYSRDTILHIKDKNALFARFNKWLRPGGRVLITDYCCKEGAHSDAFSKYVTQRGYYLLSPAQYGKVLEDAGFVNVLAEDRTDQFMAVLQKELNRTQAIKDEFIKEFSQTDYDAIVNGWKDKLVRCGQGDQRWGFFYAEKALDS
ncbi:Phosphoethanolamine N-methyltransferase [Lamellibrachia satsuma]|nr:Phosphoethanolamine N-methyltransferase [Lamellibrachia satsuma]